MVIVARKTLLVALCVATPAGCSNGEGSSASTFGTAATIGEAPTSGPGGSGSGSESDSNPGSGSASASATNTNGVTTDDPTTEPVTGDPTTDPTVGETTSGDPTQGETNTEETEGSAGGESTSTTGDVPGGTHQLYQGAYNGNDYEFGHMSIEVLDITGAPADTDWDRWAMLNDNGTFRLYFMRVGSDNTLYQLSYNAATQDYEFGLGAAIDELGITGAPADADMSSFAMLFAEGEFRFYTQSVSNPLRVHQFAYNPASQSYEYGYDGAIPQIDVTMFPGATDFSGWGMLWEDSDYRFYAFSNASHNAVAQGSYNSGSGDYEWGFQSIPIIDITGFPADANTDDFAMVHDDGDFRLYMMRG